MIPKCGIRSTRRCEESATAAVVLISSLAAGFVFAVHPSIDGRPTSSRGGAAWGLAPGRRSISQRTFWKTCTGIEDSRQLFGPMPMGARFVLAGAAAAAVVVWASRCRATNSKGEFPKLWRDLFWPKVPTLQGNFAPVADEQTDIPVEVLEGVVPKDFPKGAFVRNGPNPRGFRPGAPYHWFEGAGMLHQVRFSSDAKLPTYSNRWVRTKKLITEQAMPVPIWGGEIDRQIPVSLSNMFVNFLMKPIVALFGGDTDVTGMANTTVVVHAGRMAAITETDPPAEIKFGSLETLGTISWEGARGEPFTAHPKQINGELRWFSYRTAGLAEITYGVLDSAGASLHRSVLPVESNNLLHDCAVTERWTILADGGLSWPPPAPIEYDKTKPLRFGVIPALGGECRWIEAKPGMVIHLLSAYEDGDDIVVFGCRFDDFDLYPEEDNKVFVNPNCNPRLWEWRLHMRDGRVTERPMLDGTTRCDFPRINEAFIGQRHRWGYLARTAVEAQLEVGAPLFDALLKVDLGSERENGSMSVHEMGAGRFCGEGVFVPREGASTEDDGWVCCFAHSGVEGLSEFRIIDARNFDGPPVCRLAMPRRVPYGFHGAWVPEASIAAFY